MTIALGGGAVCVQATEGGGSNRPLDGSGHGRAGVSNFDPRAKAAVSSSNTLASAIDYAAGFVPVPMLKLGASGYLCKHLTDDVRNGRMKL